MSNQLLIIAFDVDGTLIHQVGEREDTPRYEIIQLFRSFEALGCHMIIWSGGGVDYATRWAEKLGLKAEIWAKGEGVPDIAFDDLVVELGKVNVRV